MNLVTKAPITIVPKQVAMGYMMEIVELEVRKPNFEK